MTSLEKPVARLTRGAYPVLYSRPQQIVATLAPGDLLTFRAKGARLTWTLPIDAAFRQAVRLASLAASKEKAAKRKLAKRGKL